MTPLQGSFWGPRTALPPPPGPQARRVGGTWRPEPSGPRPTRRNEAWPCPQAHVSWSISWVHPGGDLVLDGSRLFAGELGVRVSSSPPPSCRTTRGVGGRRAAVSPCFPPPPFYFSNTHTLNPVKFSPGGRCKEEPQLYFIGSRAVFRYSSNATCENKPFFTRWLEVSLQVYKLLRIFERISGHVILFPQARF